jgi:hypothetical protein
MLEDISVTGADKRWWDYRELFNSSEVRYRTMLVMAVGFFGQARQKFQPLLQTLTHFPMVRQRSSNLLLPPNACWGRYKRQPLPALPPRHANLVSFGGAVIGAIFTDRWGRRPQLLVSTGIIIVLFAVLTALNASNITYLPDGSAVAKSYSMAKPRSGSSSSSASHSALAGPRFRHYIPLNV